MQNKRVDVQRITIIIWYRRVWVIIAVDSGNIHFRVILFAFSSLIFILNVYCHILGSHHEEKKKHRSHNQVIFTKEKNLLNYFRLNDEEYFVGKTIFFWMHFLVRANSLRPCERMKSEVNAAQQHKTQTNRRERERCFGMRVKVKVGWEESWKCKKRVNGEEK